MRWVVLLRAVNLGSRNKVPMAKLRPLLEEAGYGDVSTYIASGNVLLDGPKSGTAIARELERIVAGEFGVDTTAIVRKPSELAALVSGHPFGRDTSRSHVVFLAKRPTRRPPNASPRPGPLAGPAVLSGKDVYVQYGAASRAPTLGRASREAARRRRDTPQLAHRRRAGRARSRGVGSRRQRKETSMALARVVSFDGVNSDRMAALKSEIESGEQPEGLNATEMLLLHDPGADQALAIVFFDNEGDYQKGDEILGGMRHERHAGLHGPGSRSTTSRVRMTA